MTYNRIVEGKFVRRSNRFVAEVEVGGRQETVHVKNTGRCRELLLPGATVYLEESDNPNRKTRYDLVVVRKEGLGLVNMDSQAPNKVAKEWLNAQGFSLVKAPPTSVLIHPIYLIDDVPFLFLFNVYAKIWFFPIEKIIFV